MSSKRRSPDLSPEEQARVDAARRDRRARAERKAQGARSSTVQGSTLSKAERKAKARRAELERQRILSRARIARAAREKAALDRECAAVSAKTERHLNRLREGDPECCPWDDEFIADLLGLLDRGLEDRAAAVAAVVTSTLLSWRLPDEALRQRLQRTDSPLATYAKAKREFMAFVEGRVLPAHKRWAKNEQARRLAEFGVDQPPARDQADSEVERQRATLLRRTIAKRY